ncbi:proteoglycan 4 [Lates calcarifer]|uniref:Proteoglycan 4 n=1 Tax=Lates calcarifer TaxID=8187 RepID=A0AAJ7LBZ6_LATCA|nr:proteoglycan 4 [Lates calcarifer]
MGNKFSRRRDTPANNGETVATEQTAEEPAVPQPAEESEIAQTPETVEAEDLEVVVGEVVTPVARLPSEECVAECKEPEAPAASATLNDAEPEPVTKESSAPVQTEPLVSISKPESPLESEPVAEPKPAAETEPVAEAQLAPEPEPAPAPEPVSEPEPTSNPEAEVELVPEPISESVPVPAEPLEQHTDMLTQESLPEPVPTSPPLIDLGVPDDTPQPANSPPPPAPIPDLVSADGPSDIPVAEECRDSTEAAKTSTSEPEKSEETSESPEKPMEVEAAENLEQLVSDVNEENISGLLQNLELKGNDLVSDLIPDDVKIPDDAPIIEISTSTELM